jgi:uncharacterized protein YjaG (DUF416 family)
MNTTEMKDRFEKPLLELPFSHLLTFIYFVAKRMIPNYVAFSKTEQWGDSKIVNEAANLLRTIILEKRSIKPQELEILEKLNSATPDMENFGSLLSTSALDTCIILYETISALQSNNIEAIVSLATLPFNAVQMYVEELNELDYNKKNYDVVVFSHPLIEKEIEFQEKIYTLILNQKEISKEFFEFCSIEENNLYMHLAGSEKEIEIC